LGEKQVNFRLQADIIQEAWVGVDCKVDAANKDKFAGIKKADVFAVKGIFHITQGAWRYFLQRRVARVEVIPEELTADLFLLREIKV
jgi:hypothetical protein